MGRKDSKKFFFPLKQIGKCLFNKIKCRRISSESKINTQKKKSEKLDFPEDNFGDQIFNSFVRSLHYFSYWVVNEWSVFSLWYNK